MVSKPAVSVFADRRRCLTDAGKQKRERKKRKDDGSLTEAEAIALQQQLFSQAKEGTAAPALPDAASLPDDHHLQPQSQQQ